MTQPTSALPARLQAIVEEFQDAEGREKLELLLEYSQSLPPLPAWLAEQHNDMDQVHECMSPVFVYAEQRDGRMQFYFDVPPEAPTVRGYAALMAEGLNGTTPDEIMAVPGDFFNAMGLQEVITFQRIRGISAILTYMKRLAVQTIG
ncbi:MAG TPA: SufE family protein [Anaerolineae bacterium]|nr:SufE family protein [Anaerolineae bacterium]